MLQRMYIDFSGVWNSQRTPHVAASERAHERGSRLTESSNVCYVKHGCINRESLWCKLGSWYHNRKEVVKETGRSIYRSGGEERGGGGVPHDEA